MRRTIGRVATRLEDASPTVFLIAGVLAVVSGGLNTLDMVPGVSTQSGALIVVEGLAGFGGVVLSFVAMLGLYPRLAAGAPRLAQVGVGLLLVPVVLFLTDLVWLVLSVLFGLPSLTMTYLPVPVLIIGVALFLFALGSMVFGVVAVVTPGLDRRLGALLILFSVSWYLLMGGIIVSGPPVPAWLVALTAGLQGLAMLGIGVRLRGEDRATAAVDSVAG